MVLPPDDCITCLKGLKNNESVSDNGVDHTLFFSDFHELAELPGWEGSSVNWELVGGDAERQLMDQVDKDGNPKFQSGAVRIQRPNIDYLVQRSRGTHCYELRPENGNEYHGHILLSTSLQKKVKLTLCAQLLYYYSLIPRPEN